MQNIAPPPAIRMRKKATAVVIAKEHGKRQTSSLILMLFISSDRTSALSLNLPAHGQVVGEQRVVGSFFSEVQ